ncbi:MAG: NAD(P)/FAD-dependent oxidoreductase [Kiritimatiellae bacterium]|nr:NAD(P)/FAD-dependent oxidoreductase [Kiritimatiellia bacterium]
MKNVLIIGAGPAGLTAAFELLKEGGFQVTVFEETETFGGISRTVCHKGNRMDMGGHRFFSKVPEVNEWWKRMMPPQGAPAKDDLLLARHVPLAAGGPDPEKMDRVMLIRHRVSRILFASKFYDYPVSLKMSTIRNMGFFTVMAVGFSYLRSVLGKLPETNLENFYVNRFGRKLYALFFEHYTEKLWGRHPREIDASWGAQRVKGLSVSAVFKDIFSKIFRKKDRKVETSLIEEFQYPKLGPGQLWEITAEKVREMGGKIVTGARVRSFRRGDDGRITALAYEKGGRLVEEEGDVFISSMPVKDLVEGLDGVPRDIARIAAGLPYRDYMTLGVLVKRLRLKNRTSRKTVGNIVPDCWVYVQDRAVKMGRFQIYNNWSPYMVEDLEHTVWLGLEYFVTEGDGMWAMEEKDFAEFAISEMLVLGLIESRNDVLDVHLERVKKAYPAYFDTYAEMDTLRNWLDTIPNLYCVGRNGQHRYNNIDHSMMTSFEAVRNIVGGRTDKSNVWNVNTEKEYHEADK